jgi:hypothetical protein
LIVDVTNEAAGGPAYPAGRDVKTAHLGMRISAANWAVFMRHSAATLDHFTVGPPEREEVLAFFESLRADIAED